MVRDAHCVRSHLATDHGKSAVALLALFKSTFEQSAQCKQNGRTQSKLRPSTMADLLHEFKKFTGHLVAIEGPQPSSEYQAKSAPGMFGIAPKQKTFGPDFVLGLPSLGYQVAVGVGPGEV